MDTNPGPGQLQLVGYAPTAWITATFAPNWYADAVAEAQTGFDRDSRRREILFSVCAAESYLFEWVRDVVLNRRFDELGEYFPAGDRAGVTKRWKGVMRKLVDVGRISSHQDSSGPVWQDFSSLVAYRNGLVHGRSSRPDSGDQPAGLKPVPSTNHLEQLVPGWAARVIAALIQDLHQTVGTDPPAWLVEP